MSVQRKILVVDDDAMQRELLKILLERADYEVILASDGVSGVEMSKSETPDLVIIDGLMPKMHGFLACQVIKQMTHAPKVFLLTGIYTKPRYKMEAKYQYKADEFLTKPIKPADLLALVEKHLASLPQDRPELQPASSSTETLERYKTATSKVQDPTRPAGYSATWSASASSKRELRSERV